VSLAVAKKILGYWTLIRYTGLHIESRNNNHRECIAGTDIAGSIEEDIAGTADTDIVGSIADIVGTVR
jgi:hypothetical protein